nr:transmembrane protein 14C isoform X1 [Kogia breviceps]
MQKDSGPLVPLHWIGFGYAALVASGGIIGYARAGSVPSLAAGLLFGGLAGLGAYQLSQDPRNIWVFLANNLTVFLKERQQPSRGDSLKPSASKPSPVTVSRLQGWSLHQALSPSCFTTSAASHRQRGRLFLVSRPSLMLCYIWNLGCHYGNEILPLWKIYACRLNCRCQFADGRQSWN